MITTKYFYRIRIKIRDLKKVINAYNALNEQCYIEFIPAGIFSGYVDVAYDNPNLIDEFKKEGISFITKETSEFMCVDTKHIENQTAEVCPKEISIKIENLIGHLIIVGNDIDKDSFEQEIKEMLLKTLNSVSDSFTKTDQ